MKSTLQLFTFILFICACANSFAAVTVPAGNHLVTEQPTELIKRTSVNKNVKAQRQYIVQFTDEPLIKKSRSLVKSTNVSAFKVNRNKLNTPELTSYKTLLKKKRSQFISSLKNKSPNAKSIREYDTLLNAVAVSTDMPIQEIRQLGNVQAVYPVQYYKRKLSNVLPIVKASESWALLGGQEEAGKGMKIAIIDSGIVNDHLMFNDDGMEAPDSASLPNGDYCRTTDASFCNNKIIVARHYLPTDIDLDETGESDSPLGLSGHGTHVAGIAAGREVTEDVSNEVISGVAPGAYIMAYKALWGQDGTGSDIELLAAMNDAVADGADVINNSWGGNSGGAPSSSLYKNLYEELEADGIIIVSAAGNEGSEDATQEVGTISCPACVEAGITVGATTTDVVSLLPVSFGSQTIYGQEGSNNAVTSDITSTATIAPTNNSLGCDAWSANVLTGDIAIVTRGTCTFEVKAQNAQDAGAIGLIVINNIAGNSTVMAIDDSTLPAILVDEADGANLVSVLETSPATQITIGSILEVTKDSSLQDFVASFSSIGPNGDDSFIKPDLAAPGASVISATSEFDLSSLGVDFTRLSGTSMASPVVAGAAILLKQKSPELTPLQIKSILVNSADAVSKSNVLDGEATAFETGAGRLNILNALNATAYAVTPNMVAKSCNTECSVTNTLTTLTNTSSTWTASVEFDNELVTGSASPSQLTLSSANTSDTFTLNINVPLSLEQSWYFGRVQWTSNTSEIINQAVAVSNKYEPSELLQIDITNSGNDGQSITLISNTTSGSEDIDISLILTGDVRFEGDSLIVTGNAEHQVLTEEKQAIEISATVNAASGSTNITAQSAPFEINLEDEGVTPIDCDTDGCDEIAYTFDFDFNHFGQSYSSFNLTDNGFIIAGDDYPVDANFYTNTAFPNTVNPNNVIAPFWADFDLEDLNITNDTGGGNLFVATNTFNGIEYLVIQWNKVKLYLSNEYTAADAGVSNEDVEFTFQLILQADSDNKWFRYIDIPEQPNLYTVGLENETGSNGFTYWFDGIGGVSSVSTGDELFAQTAVIGSISLDVDFEGDFTEDDTVETTENTAVTFSPLDNDNVSSDPGVLTATVNEQNYVTELSASATAIEQSSLVITSSPSNGTATLSNGNIIYTPESGYSGTDQLTYSVENDQGLVASSVVSIEVTSKKKDKGFLGLSLGMYLQGLLVLLILIRSTSRKKYFVK